MPRAWSAVCSRRWLPVRFLTRPGRSPVDCCWPERCSPPPDCSSCPFLESGYRPNRLLKKAHLLRCPHPSSLRRTSKYASLLSISGALHLGIFEQPAKNDFFSRLLVPVLFSQHNF